MNPGYTAVASLILAAFGFWLRPFVQRWFQKRYEYSYLLKELDDIHRHLGANLKVMGYIEEDGQVPAPMHINKLKIPESSAIFSIETLKLADFKYSSRLYDLRLKLRNLNLEIDDILVFSDPKYVAKDFFELIRYHKQKTELVAIILKEELSVLTNKAHLRPQQSAVLRRIVPRPRLIDKDASVPAEVRPTSLANRSIQVEEAEAAEPKVSDSPDASDRPRDQG